MTNDFEFTFLGRLVITPETADETIDSDAIVRAVFEKTMNELCNLTDAVDPSVSGSVAEGTIEISLTAVGESLPAAMQTADTLVRTALHAADVSTKNWSASGAVFVDFRRVTVDDPDLDPEMARA